MLGSGFKVCQSLIRSSALPLESVVGKPMSVIQSQSAVMFQCRSYHATHKAESHFNSLENTSPFSSEEKKCGFLVVLIDF